MDARRLPGYRTVLAQRCAMILLMLGVKRGEVAAMFGRTNLRPIERGDIVPEAETLDRVLREVHRRANNVFGYLTSSLCGLTDDPVWDATAATLRDRISPHAMKLAANLAWRGDLVAQAELYRAELDAAAKRAGVQVQGELFSPVPPDDEAAIDALVRGGKRFSTITRDDLEAARARMAGTAQGQ